MQYCMEYGDTNFIGVVNPEKYKSFVDEDWELGMLLQHFANEMRAGNILVFQMTEDGNEHSWKVNVQIGEEIREQKHFRKAEGYIEVTNNQLYLVDYSCLTMAAQFEDERVPDKYCSNYKINVDNGVYKVDIVQFYNVDKEEHIGNKEVDILMNFTKVSDFKQIVNKVFWCIY